MRWHLASELAKQSVHLSPNSGYDVPCKGPGAARNILISEQMANYHLFQNLAAPAYIHLDTDVCSVRTRALR